MISPAEENSVDVLPDLLAVTGRGMGINSSRTEVGSTTDAVEAEMVTGTSSAVTTIVAASMATEVAANLASSEPSVGG